MPSALRKLISTLLNGRPFSRSAIHVLWAKGSAFRSILVMRCHHVHMEAFMFSKVNGSV